jgi:hypothetical protein
MSYAKLASSVRQVLVHPRRRERTKKALQPAAQAEEHTPGNRKAAMSPSSVRTLRARTAPFVKAGEHET